MANILLSIAFLLMILHQSDSFRFIYPSFVPVSSQFAIISKGQTALQAGFGKPRESIEQASRIPWGGDQCSCGSGKQYSECCQQYHNNSKDPTNPVQVIRARFSALTYGVVPFLTKTTHPDNREYVSEDNDYIQVGSKKTKRTIWEKEVR